MAGAVLLLLVVVLVVLRVLLAAASSPAAAASKLLCLEWLLLSLLTLVLPLLLRPVLVLYPSKRPAADL